MSSIERKQKYERKKIERLMVSIVKKFTVVMFCFMLLLLSGCWNNRNLTDLGVVVGLGFDKVSDDEVEITIQLLKPSILESRKQGSMQKATSIISATGKTAFEANRNLLTKINKRLFYSHIQLLVIGEELARNGIDDTLDFFQRVHEIDKREVLLISKGITAKEVLEVESVQADISTLEITDIIRNTNRLATIRRITLYDVIMITTAGGNPVVGKVEAWERKENLKMTDLDFTGAAVFNKDKLVGWLNPIETYGFLITDNKFKNPILSVPNPISPESNITIEIDRSTAKKNVYFKNEKPVLCVEVQTTGKVVEQGGKGDLTSAEQIKALEAEVSQQMQKIISNVIFTAQTDLNTDIFSFGDIVHKKYLTYWRNAESNWNNIFSDLPVEIKVKYNNSNMGFIKAHK